MSGSTSPPRPITAQAPSTMAPPSTGSTCRRRTRRQPASIRRTERCAPETSLRAGQREPRGPGGALFSRAPARPPVLRLTRALPALLRSRYRRLLGPRPQPFVPRQDPGTGVPPQNRLVVPRRPARLGLLVPVHRLVKPAIGELPRTQGCPAYVGLGAALADDAGVVESPVLVIESRQQLPGPAHAFRGAFGELIRDGEQQGDQRLLVPGLELQHIEADAFGGRRVVDDAVSLGLLKGGGDALPRDSLERELVAHGCSLLLNSFTSRLRGS